MTSTATIIRSPAPARGFLRPGHSLREVDRELARRLYLAPTALLRGAAAEAAVDAGNARWLAGGPTAFAACTLFLRDHPGGERIEVCHVPLTDLHAWAVGEGEAVAEHVDGLLHFLAADARPYAGLDLSRPNVMGIVNVTPDSFSDGGDHADPEAAVAAGLRMLDAGADLLDIGGESTRPGSPAVAPDEEIRRVVPVIRELAGRGVILSIDTRNAATMAAALDAGAVIVNDVTGLTHDAAALPLVVARQAPTMLMHIQGKPQTMQADPIYGFCPLDVFDWLDDRVRDCVVAGLHRDKLMVDPGIGFGKTVDHNLELIAHLGLLLGMGCPVLLGVSRKSFIGRLGGVEAPKARLPGSLAAGLAGLEQGARVLRVHDVAETAQAVAVWKALQGVA